MTTIKLHNIKYFYHKETDLYSIGAFSYSNLFNELDTKTYYPLFQLTLKLMTYITPSVKHVSFHTYINKIEQSFSTKLYAVLRR